MKTQYIAMALATPRQAEYGYWSPCAVELVSGGQIPKEVNKMDRGDMSVEPEGVFDSIEDVKAAWEKNGVDTKYFRVLS
jgi:hypothetical protein